MRGALWLVVLFVVAVASALLAGSNHSTVTVFWDPYRVDLSMNLVLLVLVFSFVVLHLSIKTLGALLARHFDVARHDLTQVQQDLQTYFDTDNRQGQNALALAKEVLARTKQTELPRLDDTLAALTTAAAGR